MRNVWLVLFYQSFPSLQQVQQQQQQQLLAVMVDSAKKKDQQLEKLLSEVSLKRRKERQEDEENSAAQAQANLLIAMEASLKKKDNQIEQLISEVRSLRDENEVLRTPEKRVRAATEEQELGRGGKKVGAVEELEARSKKEIVEANEKESSGAGFGVGVESYGNVYGDVGDLVMWSQEGDEGEEDGQGIIVENLDITWQDFGKAFSNIFGGGRGSVEESL